METNAFHRLRERISQLEDLSLSEADELLKVIRIEEPEIADELRMIWQKMCEPELPIDRFVARAQPLYEAANEHNIDDLAGRIFGNYLLKVWIGEGGMGEVYLAERLDQKGLIAAVKVLRLGTPAIRRQFEQEQSILAGLRHPGIAYFLDCGTTHDGLSYLVMEYVEGIPVTEYCNRFRLTLEHRLNYFLEICETVKYAHKHLVVHRDLKPSNILITPEGRLKLLDFGIAKLLQPTSNRVKTQLHFLTPDYASPEQLMGEPITTASDVYSLGVLLYELLVQVRPHNFEQKNLGQILEIIQNDQLKVPSAYLTTLETAKAEAVAQMLKTTSGYLTRKLNGDLDVIIRKTLTINPNERYNSAETLAQDIQLFLENKPIHARKPTITYKTIKFYERNKRAVLSAVLIFHFLMFGIGAIAFQQMENWKQTQRSEELAIFLENILLGQSNEGQQAVQLDSLRARQLIQLGWQKIEDRLKQQPEMQVRILTALSELASSNGFWITADTLALNAIRKSEVVQQTPALSIRAYLQGATTATSLSKTTTSDTYLKKAWGILNQQMPRDRKTRVRIRTARAQNALLIYDTERAYSELKAALTEVKPLEDRESYLLRGEIYRQLGFREVLREAPPLATKHYQEALMAFQLAYGRYHPAVLEAMVDLSRMFNLARREDEAQYLLLEAEAIAKTSHTELPRIQAMIEIEIANSFYGQARFDKAVEYYVRAEEKMKKQFPHLRNLNIQLSASWNLASIYFQSGKTEQYQQALRRSLSLSEKLFNASDKLYQPHQVPWIQSCITRAENLSATGAYMPAIAQLGRCINVVNPDGKEGHLVSLARIRLAEVYILMQKYDIATNVLSIAREVEEKRKTYHQSIWGELRSTEGWLAWQQNRTGHTLLRTGYEMLLETRGIANPATQKAYRRWQTANG